jgi:SNF2 family DNA or RNA helicase
MIFNPRPWQPPMLHHVSDHRRCAVFAHMGSGKTGAVLHALNGIGLLDEAPALILGPKRVAVGREDDEDDLGVWHAEGEKWDSFSHEIVPIAGSQTQRLQAIGRRELFFATNYEQLPWLVKFHGRNWPYRTIISDEITRLKGMREGGQGGQRTNALAKVAFAPVVERFIGLTGTPAPNGYKDLWGQLWFLDHGKRLGSTYTGFKQRWFQRSWDGYGIEPLACAHDQINERIRDICLTIDPRDYGLKLDDIVENEIVVDLPDKARDLYRQMERTMFIELEHDLGSSEVEAAHAAARTNKCLQLANGFIYHHDGHKGAWAPVHDAKLAALESIVEEANGMPLLISVQFKPDFEMIKRAFPKFRTIDEVNLKDWDRGRVPGMICHPASAGHGLNLQLGSNILVDYSSGWNLEYDDQVIERIGPMRQYQSGLDRLVYRYRIMAEGTVDYLVKQRRETKRSVQSILMEAMKRKEMSNA